MLSILDKLEELDRQVPNNRAVMDVVECFATCALRNASAIREDANMAAEIAQSRST